MIVTSSCSLDSVSIQGAKIKNNLDTIKSEYQKHGICAQKVAATMRKIYI